MATNTPTSNAGLGYPVGLDNLGAAEIFTPSPTLSTGVAVVPGFRVQHFGNIGGFVTTEIWMQNMPFVFASGTAGSQFVGTKLFTFPRGKINILGAASFLQETTVTALAGSLLASKSVQYGLGSATASADTLATTMINVLAGSGQTVPTFTSSATVDVAGTAVTHHNLAALPAPLDGSSTALPLFFNMAVATDGDLVATATVLISAFFIINWSNLGGWQYRPFTGI